MAPVKFWGERPQVLWEDDNWRKFVPKQGASLHYNLNAVTRFSIYLGVLTSIYKLKWTWLLIIAVPVMLLTIVMFAINGKKTRAYRRKKLSRNSNSYDDDEGVEMVVGSATVGKYRRSKRKSV